MFPTNINIKRIDWDVPNITSAIYCAVEIYSSYSASYRSNDLMPLL